MARPVNKTSEQWKREILRAAEMLFAKKGYDQTSVEDIMQSVGGAKGMFYHSFSKKEELLDTLVDRWAEEYAASMAQVLNDQKSTFAEMFSRVQEVILRMAGSTAGIEVFFARTDQVVLKKLTDEMTSKLIPPLSRALRRGVEEGILSVQDTDFYAAYMIFGALGALNAGQGTPKENIAKNISHLSEIVADTLHIDRSVLCKHNPKEGEQACKKLIGRVGRS